MDLLTTTAMSSDLQNTVDFTVNRGFCWKALTTWEPCSSCCSLYTTYSSGRNFDRSLFSPLTYSLMHLQQDHIVFSLYKQLNSYWSVGFQRHIQLQMINSDLANTNHSAGVCVFFLIPSQPSQLKVGRLEGWRFLHSCIIPHLPQCNNNPISDLIISDSCLSYQKDIADIASKEMFKLLEVSGYAIIYSPHWIPHSRDTETQTRKSINNWNFNFLFIQKRTLHLNSLKEKQLALAIPTQNIPENCVLGGGKMPKTHLSKDRGAAVGPQILWTAKQAIEWFVVLPLAGLVTSYEIMQSWFFDNQHTNRGT